MIQQVLKICTRTRIKYFIFDEQETRLVYARRWRHLKLIQYSVSAALNHPGRDDGKFTKVTDYGLFCACFLLKSRT